jgi:hypothetical protein
MTETTLFDAARLHWHVPRHRATALRFRLSQLACVAVVLAVLAFLFVAPEQRWPTLGMIAGLSLCMALWQWWRSRPSAELPPNVWLDATGFHWLTTSGHEQCIDREHISGYWIGFDDDTQHALPALTLLLHGAWLSQPIEMHPPVDARQLKAWFREQWGLAACEHLPEPPLVSIPLRAVVDDERQRWEIAGSPAALQQLAQTWHEIAATGRVPPPGARPAETRLQFEAASGMLVCIASESWIEQGMFNTSPEQLAALADDLAAWLATSEPTHSIDFACDTGHLWTWHFMRLA